MMRSLYSAVSGLQAHQIKMDVVGNNIANVNTIGFKKGQVTFQDMLSQTLNSGMNLKQVGTGVVVGAINNIHSQGAASTTGNTTDLLIQGQGYFTLTDGTNNFYCRAGAFSIDSVGNLVNTTNGMKVCDHNGAAITIAGSNIAIASDGTISYNDAVTGNPTIYGSKIGISTFSNPGGLEKNGDNMYSKTVSSGPAVSTTPGTNAGTLISGALEMSNVDLAQEFVDMIITQRGFQANAKTIRSADEMLQELLSIKR
jgi:flagellar hook protein FlgE